MAPLTQSATDLLGDQQAVIRPPLLSCIDFLPPNEQASLLRWCRETVEWRQTELSFGGRSVPVPRLIAWFGEADYTYSGVRNRALPMPDLLRTLADEIEAWMARQGQPARFNSCLANYYRDGSDSIGMHSDDEKEIKPGSAIASISLGATCVFRFEHKATKTKVAEPLPGGSLLVMVDDCQTNWKHGIRKEPGRGPRVNLTYRFTRRLP